MKIFLFQTPDAGVRSGIPRWWFERMSRCIA
jgi:hypothetical protein